ncbi:hypothetical protein GX50_07813 [[Emmonsia] crescens]|uniref:Uncharacterized protein n=1 Tax=[Emmonsia] crescens TaxID=73230 RepID=A0A2B7Z8A0_9EURO|nr:hypothetical protein GX50_07813 [Emmonsia crescens]
MLLRTGFLLRARLANRIQFVPQTTCPPAQITRATFGIGSWLNCNIQRELLAARVSNALKTDVSNHHLIAIFYYKNSSVYELDVTIPKDTDISASVVNQRLQVTYQGSSFGEFLKRNLESLPMNEERKLCLTIARGASGKVRSLRFIGNKYGVRGVYTAEVQVGSYKDWENNHSRVYGEGRDMMLKEFGDGVTMRLCQRKHLTS